MSTDLRLGKVDWLRLALNFAAKAHEGHVDKGGYPVLAHVMRVSVKAADLASTMFPALPPDLVYTVGVLHDVVEDSETTIEELEKCFPAEVTDAVRAVTRDLTHETYAQYIDRVALSGPLARVVKIADLHDHLDPSRLHAISSGLIERYRSALITLGVVQRL